VACFEVSEPVDVPDGMVVREVLAHKYAVFTHHGKLDNLHETYKYIYETWVPGSGLALTSPHFDIELYGDHFMFDSDDSAFDIYVAIEG
jgi:AraC family transcriptional regulator